MNCQSIDTANPIWASGKSGQHWFFLVLSPKQSLEHITNVPNVPNDALILAKIL